MLIARESFERVDGFGAGYRYGTEDVDLGLKLLLGGSESARCWPGSVLIHRESSSQNRESHDFRRLNRMENRRLFLELWGPQVRREYRLARLRQRSFLDRRRGRARRHHADKPRRRATAGVTGTQVTRSATPWRHQGWRVSYVERKGDSWYRAAPMIWSTCCR